MLSTASLLGDGSSEIGPAIPRRKVLVPVQRPGDQFGEGVVEGPAERLGRARLGVVHATDKNAVRLTPGLLAALNAMDASLPSGQAGHIREPLLRKCKDVETTAELDF
ncbi:MAG: hypothetical protein ACR2HR_17685 [Euzebya sp.]